VIEHGKQLKLMDSIEHIMNSLHEKEKEKDMMVQKEEKRQKKKE